jgi:hypothetical protein
MLLELRVSRRVEIIHRFEELELVGGAVDPKRLAVQVEEPLVWIKGIDALRDAWKWFARADKVERLQVMSAGVIEANAKKVKLSGIIGDPQKLRKQYAESGIRYKLALAKTKLDTQELERYRKTLKVI